MLTPPARRIFEDLFAAASSRSCCPQPLGHILDEAGCKLLAPSPITGRTGSGGGVDVTV